MFNSSKKILFVCTPGYEKNSGYYFRVNRDIEICKSFGYEIDILVLNKISSFISCALKGFKGYHRIFLENIGAALPFFFRLMLRNKRFNKNVVLVNHGSLDDLDSYKFSALRKPLYSYMEKLIFKSEAKKLCVSNYMREALIKKYGVDGKNVLVSPNIPSRSFFLELNKAKEFSKNCIRERFGLPKNKKILCYSGNTQAWQRADFFCTLSSNLTNEFFILVLTQDVNYFRSRLSGLDDDMYKVITVHNNLIPWYLTASDVLYMLRDSGETNQFSCPTKGVEYILARKPILITNGIGDISEEAESLGVGLTFDLSKKDVLNEILKELFEVDFLSSNKFYSDSPVFNKYTLESSVKTFKAIL